MRTSRFAPVSVSYLTTSFPEDPGTVVGSMATYERPPSNQRGGRGGGVERSPAKIRAMVSDDVSTGVGVCAIASAESSEAHARPMPQRRAARLIVRGVVRPFEKVFGTTGV